MAETRRGVRNNDIFINMINYMGKKEMRETVNQSDYKK